MYLKEKINGKECRGGGICKLSIFQDGFLLGQTAKVSGRRKNGVGNEGACAVAASCLFETGEV